MVGSGWGCEEERERSGEGLGKVQAKLIVPAHRADLAWGADPTPEGIDFIARW